MNPAYIHPPLYSSPACIHSPLVFIPACSARKMPNACDAPSVCSQYPPPPLDDINVGADALEQVSR